MFLGYVTRCRLPWRVWKPNTESLRKNSEYNFFMYEWLSNHSRMYVIAHGSMQAPLVVCEARYVTSDTRASNHKPFNQCILSYNFFLDGDRMREMRDRKQQASD